jgi:bifunctional non-homologous end joining protein LigD
MGLQVYKRKRTFSKTPEPEGKKTRGGGSLRFVVQKHDASHLHYDFRLEMEGVLKSWAIPKGPSLNPGDKRLAMMVEDHPLEYRTFEGRIPEGNYGAGSVIVWDEGTYEPLEGGGEEELKKGLEKGDLKFILHGKKLKGAYALVKIKNSRDKKNNAWLLIKKKDEFASTDDVTSQDASVKSGKTLEQIGIPENNKKIKKKKISLPESLKGPMPHHIKPMLATLADEPFDGEDWFFEIKWDGYRTIAEVSGKNVELYSRNQISFNEHFPDIAAALREIGHDVVLDGEVVALDEKGRGSFQLLQNYLKTRNGTLRYYVFDLLYIDGYDIRELPLEERKKILSEIIDETDLIKISGHVERNGKEFFEAAKKQGLEGIIAKNRNSPYRTGARSKDWLKIKTHMRQEAVIGGFTEPRGSRKQFGALVLGVYDGKDLNYIGHTGGGFDERKLKDVHARLKKLAIKESPFKTPPKTNAPVTWVKPELVSEVSFQEWTSDGRMRQPIFEGVREDKDPREVKRERPVESYDTNGKATGKFFGGQTTKKESETKVRINGKTLILTNLDKVYWPEEGYTKGDLIEYYRRISPIILPYLKDRPESLHRHPNGIQGESFFQKDVDHQPPSWVKTVPIFSESNDKVINYLVCQNEATLVYMANLGCIELNPWNSRIKKLDYPDFLIIDLDPENISFEHVIEAAQVVHKMLDSAKIPNYCKTSGASGLHICIPLGANYTYDQTKDFAHAIALMAHERLPMTTSVERSPSKRQKKVYLDYLQNRRGQTLAAPYSLRPQPGAPVSTPLDWREVKKDLDPRKWNIKTIHARIAKIGDIWKPVLGKGIDLGKSIANLQSL